MTIQSHPSTQCASVAVYLNDSRASTFGFTPDDSQLRLAARFTIPAPADARAAVEALEGIYVQLNIGGDLVAALDYTEGYRAAGNRSLSVGDVVVIGEAAFAVARFGFEPISAAALSAALTAVASS